MRVRIVLLIGLFSLASILYGANPRADGAHGRLSQGKVKRHNWVCPNGNSFEGCTHECKWIVMNGNKPDRENERQCGVEIAAHSPQLKKIYEMYERVYNSCGKEENMVQERTPCNYFAGMVLAEVYGIKDLKNTYGDPYKSASEINTHVFLYSGVWRPVDGETAIDLANQGYAVIASVPTHVAVVVPGGYKYLDRWGAYVPQVASMFIDDPKKGKPTFRCMPCFANEAFSGPPKYYIRY